MDGGRDGVGGLEVRLLGAVEVLADREPVVVGQPGLRALLAVLALSAGRAVSSGVLVEALWDEEWSREREANLHSRVYRLRRLLAGAEPGREGQRLVTAAPGYRLLLAEGELDAGLFRRLAADGRAAARAGGVAAAAGILAAALRLWRGPALADVAAMSPRLAAEATGLEELRLAVTEDRADAGLAAGGHAELAVELIGPVAQHPLRERLRCQLMLALYRSGRRAEALESYHQGRLLLADELGIDPGPDLRSMYQQILTADPALAAPDVGGAISVSGSGNAGRAIAEEVLRSLDGAALRTNLPGQLSAFVGRKTELAEVTALVEASRLVTLTGAGGSGKTRLALQAAAGLADDRSPDGVWLVELAPLADPAQLPDLVALVLGIRAEGGATVIQALIGVLSDRQMLLVLDNCEHVISAAAALASQIGRRCPAVRVLATSREPLGIDGERVYRVPPMSLPPQDAETAADLEGSDAVALFAERAADHDTSFALEDSIAGLVGSVCRRLDGIPLALELAAARLATMSLEHLAGRLDQRFRLLTGGSRNALPRQQTLHAMIDWSHALLSGPERAVLRRLSVFVGGFELEAAEAVCAGDGVAEFEVVGLTGSLVDKSLVVAERSGGSLQYRLLETIRQYGLEQLVQAGAGEAGRVQDAHARFYLQLAETAAPQLRGPGQGRWFGRLDAEWDNLKAALAYLFAAPDQTQAVLRLGVALRDVAYNRGRYDVVPYLRSALERPAVVPGPLRVRAMLSAGWQEMTVQGQGSDMAAVRSAARLGGSALELARQLGDDSSAADALTLLSQVASCEEDRSRAVPLSEQAVTLAHRADDPWLIGRATHWLAILLTTVSADPAPADLARARQLCLDNLDRSRQLGDQITRGVLLEALALAEVQEGHLDAARRHFEEAIASAAQTGSVGVLPDHQCNLGEVLVLQGRPEDAAPLFHAALLTSRQRGHRLGVVWAIRGLACAGGSADASRAAQLLGAVDALTGNADVASRWRLTQAEQRMEDHCRAELRDLLGEAEFQRACEVGAGLSYEQAANLALGRADSGG